MGKMLRIGDVADRIGRGVVTIKLWYKWIETQPESVRESMPLPTVHILDNRGTRFFDEDDIPILESFRDSIGYGMLTEVTRSCWGKRGSKEPSSN